MAIGDVERQTPFKVVNGVISEKRPGDVVQAKCIVASLPAHYERDQKWQAEGHATAAERYTILSPNQLTINVNDAGYVISTQQELDLSLEATWDQVVTDYRVAATRAGLDFYIYACQPTPTTDLAPVLVISANSTFPTGYTADNSRKVGGFHALCVAAGDIAGAKTARANTTAYGLGIVRRPNVANSRYYRVVIAGNTAGAEPAAFTADTTLTGTLVVDGTVTWRCEGHDLNDYAQGDIITESVWDLKHRPRSSPEGMVYDPQSYKWIDIYLASGTGLSTTSVNGGTISDTRDWMDFVDDGHAVNKHVLDDDNFQSAAAGSNEETNILGSADPVTTGGHSDTAGQRMISNIGCEDMCGAISQWLNQQGHRIEGNHTHTQTITHKAAATGSAIFKDQAETTPNAVLGSAADEDITSDATEIAAWAWYNLPGSKGALYRQGTYGDVKFAAGGFWDDGTQAGSRCRLAFNYRWDATTYLGMRFLAEPM